ncbi:hypothetical protein [Ferruginibacter sp.]|nr:hypothetical protein [Ferruginibacter sp.]
MKYVKFLVLNIIVFGVLFTLISLLFPSVIQTSKTINIGGGENKILNKLSDVTSWKKWNMFSQTDSLTNATVMADSTMIVTKWEFNRGRKLQCEIAVYKSTTDSIPVSFTITEKLKWYPWEKFRALVSDKAMSNAVELSLDNLKKQIELEK